MADTNDGQNMEPENETQESAMPTEEQKTPEAPAQAEAVVDEQPISPEQTDVSGLPDTASDRTREQFEKLRGQLSQERTEKKRLEEIFSLISTPQAPPQQEVVTPVYDPETGLLNESVLNDVQRRAQQAEERARRAELAVQQYAQDQEAKETYASHPELDPKVSETFNKEFHVETRRILLDAMLNPQDYGSQQLSFKQAADIAKKNVSKKTAEVVAQAKEEGAKEAMEKIEPKEQASLEATGSPNRAGEILADEEQDLVIQSRQGRPGAMAERLAKLRQQQS